MRGFWIGMLLRNWMQLIWCVGDCHNWRSVPNIHFPCRELKDRKVAPFIVVGLTCLTTLRWWLVHFKYVPCVALIPHVWNGCEAMPVNLGVNHSSSHSSLWSMLLLQIPLWLLRITPKVTTLPSCAVSNSAPLAGRWPELSEKSLVKSSFTTYPHSRTRDA